MTRGEARYWLLLQLAAAAAGVGAGIWLFRLIAY
jgi:hypothetical protein